MTIAGSVEIEPGLIVRHDDGLLYGVEDARQSTAGYEITHRLGSATVNYTQLQDGGYPAGTKWSKDEAGFRAHFTVEDRADIEGYRAWLNVLGTLYERMCAVTPGEYEMVTGSNTPLIFDKSKLVTPAQRAERDASLVALTPPTLPGTTLLARYEEALEDGRSLDHPVVSFLYHKHDTEGQFEKDKRVVVLTGMGYGVHPGHLGQDPALYLVGAQIGTVNADSGQLALLESRLSEIPVKSFSVACIAGGPLGEPVLANPI